MGLFRSGDRSLGYHILGTIHISLMYSILRTPYGGWKHQNKVRKDSRVVKSCSKTVPDSLSDQGRSCVQLELSVR